MADIYKAKIISITKVDNRLDIGVELYRNLEKFPCPAIGVEAESATKDGVIELIKAELTKLKAGYTAEALLQKYIGTEVTL